MRGFFRLKPATSPKRALQQRARRYHIRCARHRTPQTAPGIARCRTWRTQHRMHHVYFPNDNRLAFAMPPPEPQPPCIRHAPPEPRPPRVRHAPSRATAASHAPRLLRLSQPSREPNENRFRPPAPISRIPCIRPGTSCYVATITHIPHIKPRPRNPDSVRAKMRRH